MRPITTPRSEGTWLYRVGEYPAGTVRLVAPLIHEIAEQAITWSASLYRVAEHIAHMVASAASGA